MRTNHLLDIPDLPLEAFRHVGDRKIKLHGPVSSATNAITSAVSSVENTIGSAASDVVGAGTDVLNAVANTAGKVIDNTISSAIADPIGTIAKIGTAIYAPAALPFVAAGDALLHGASPLQVAENVAAGYVASNLTSGLGSEVANSTDSQLAGNVAQNAATSGVKAALTGQNPLNAIENSAINTIGNAGLKDLTDTSNLPSLNFASALNPSTTSTQKNGATLSGQPTTTASNSPSNLSAENLGLPDISMPNLSLGNLSLPTLALKSLSQGSSELAPKTTTTLPSSPSQLNQIYASIEPNTTANMKHGGLAHLASGGGLSTLKVPTISSLDTYTQIDPTIDPTEDLVYNNRLVTPAQMGLLATNPIEFLADGGSIGDQNTQTIDYSQIAPELLALLQQHVQKYPDGGLVVEHSGVPVEDKRLVNGWDVSGLSPHMLHEYQPTMLRPQARPNLPHIGQLSQSAEAPHLGDQLTQLDQGPLSHLIHHAHGGKIHEYENAAPEGHHPEFITGLTGYYAHGGGTGQSDDIPAMLHDGDYVADADLVAALGDGSSKAGAQALEHFRRSIPHHEGAGGHPVPAQIADGEYVFPANFVTAIGHGDNKAGAKLLDKMREEVRAHKRSAPDTKIPPKAKSPLEYLKMAAKG